MLNILVLFAALAAGTTVQFQSGTYGVGTTQYVIPHVTTNDPVNGNGTTDFFLLTMYYPTNAKTNQTQPYFDPRSAEIYTDAYHYQPGALANLTTTIQPNAEPANTTLPTIFFLPGAGENTYMYYYILLGDMASKGYPIATIDHPYENPAQLLPNGTTLEGLSLDAEWTFDFADRVYDYRITDASAFLAMYSNLTLEHNLPFNTTHLIAIGHSLGGAAAAGILALPPPEDDMTFLGGVNLDGSFYDTPDVEKPFLLMSSLGHVAGPDGDPSWTEFTDNQTDWWSLLSVYGSGHLDYSDAVVWQELTGNTSSWVQLGYTIEPFRMVEIVRNYVYSFVDYVMGNQSAQMVFDTPSLDWWEVIFVNDSTRAANSSTSTGQRVRLSF